MGRFLKLPKVTSMKNLGEHLNEVFADRSKMEAAPSLQIIVLPESIIVNQVGSMVVVSVVALGNQWLVAGWSHSLVQAACKPGAQSKHGWVLFASYCLWLFKSREEWMSGVFKKYQTLNQVSTFLALIYTQCLWSVHCVLFALVPEVFPANVQFETHMMEFLKHGYRSSIGNCEVRFPLATGDRRILPFTVGLDDGFVKILLMFSIVAFTRELEIEMKDDDGSLKRVLESFRSVRCSYTFFENPSHHFLHSLSYLVIFVNISTFGFLLWEVVNVHMLCWACNCCQLRNPMGNSGEASSKSHQHHGGHQGNDCCGKTAQPPRSGCTQGHSWQGDCWIQQILLQQAPQNWLHPPEFDIQSVL